MQTLLQVQSDFGGTAVFSTLRLPVLSRVKSRNEAHAELA